MSPTSVRRGAVFAIAFAPLALASTQPPPQQDLPAGITAKPLRARSTAPVPRFRLLTEAATGLAFANVLRPENRFTYLTNGAGMAVGDYDRDGLPDIYLVSQDGPNRLFRQDAPLHFTDVTQTAGNVDGGEAWGTGASFADVDSDGWLDLYVCNMEAKNKLYRNRGDGTFEECAARFQLDVAAASTMAAFADYDRDGDLDVYLLTNRALHAGWALTPEVLDGFVPPKETARPMRAMVPSLEDLADPLVQRLARGGGDLDLENAVLPARLREHYFVFRGRLYMAGQRDRLLRNDAGRFVDATAVAGIHDHGMGLSATWWDYDDDGDPDLYVANDLETPDQLWRNDGGTFTDVTKAALPHTAYYGMGSDAGDIDGDGRLDFFVGDMSATTHRMAKILMGDMTAQRDFLMHAQPPQYMRNALYVNTGTGRFLEAAFLAGVASTDWTWSTLFGDLDGDGRLDLYCTNGIARFDMNPDLEQKKKDLWQQQRTGEAIELIKTIPAVPEANLALRNAGYLQFEKAGAAWGLDQVGISHGAVLCDLDRDGDLDVITNNLDSPAAVFENLSNDAHAVAVTLRGRGKNTFGIGARVELRTEAGLQVRENWLARGYLSGQEPRVCFGVGTATQVALTVRWPSGQEQRFADLAVDGDYTVTEPELAPTNRAPAPPPASLFEPCTHGPGARHRERPFDEYREQFLLPQMLSQLGPGLAVGDADEDGDDDVFAGGAAGQAGSLWRNDGGTFAAVAGPWQHDQECEDMGALWLDHDSDGDLDLFVCSGGVEHRTGDDHLQPRLYRNDGGLRFARDDSALPELRASHAACCAADIDLDGDLDLFLGGMAVAGSYPDAPPSRLLRNDGGRFVDVTRELAPALLTAGMVRSAVFFCLSGDAYPDLLVAAQWQPLRYLHNGEGRAFVDRTAEAGLATATGLWNSLAALDADGDGDTDFVAGNLGRNTKYKAGGERPLGLLFADFDGNGTRDLVETKYEGDRLLPVRGRSCSSQAMPFLLQKFPTYEQFASSVLGDIYPQECLAACGKLEVTCLDSMLVRNDGDERFTLVPLPRIAQLAPIFGLGVADFDADGRQDVVAATNFYGPEPETGRFDGGMGLLLRGSATGLVSVPPLDSGIRQPSDLKGAAVLDVDGDGRPDVLFASNDAELQCVRNAGRQPGLTVQLAGPPGNPTGVGALVGVQRADGSTQHCTLFAGSGYLSQSSARAWFARGPVPITAVVVLWPDGKETRLDRELDRSILVIAP